MISLASLALRVIAISSTSQPNSRASSRRTLSTRGSSTRHMCSTGSSLVKRRSRIIASSTWLGVGLTPPLLRLIIVRSASNARWISPQYASSSAIAAGPRSPAIVAASRSARPAPLANGGAGTRGTLVAPAVASGATRALAAADFRKERRLGMEGS